MKLETKTESKPNLGGAFLFQGGHGGERKGGKLHAFIGDIKVYKYEDGQFDFVLPIEWKLIDGVKVPQLKLLGDDATIRFVGDEK